MPIVITAYTKEKTRNGEVSYFLLGLRLEQNCTMAGTNVLPVLPGMNEHGSAFRVPIRV